MRSIPSRITPQPLEKGASVARISREVPFLGQAAVLHPTPLSPPCSIEAWAEAPARVRSLGPGSGCTACSGRALRWLQIGCLLLAFPSDNETCSEYLDGKYVPRAESERGRCCSCWNPSPPPRRVPGGDKGRGGCLSEIPNPADALQTPFACNCFPCFFCNKQQYRSQTAETTEILSDST